MAFVNERTVKAVRKPGRCDGCNKMVEIGQPAIRWAGMTPDNEFATALYHPECRDAEVALNRLYETRSDEWMLLGDYEPDDKIWLIAEHPVAASRLGLAA